MKTRSTPATAPLRKLQRSAFAGLVPLLVATSACYGPHTITYVDSSRAPGKREHSHDIDRSRVEYDKCGASGVARIETYSGWFDMLVSYLSFSPADRSADIICGKEQ